MNAARSRLCHYGPDAIALRGRDLVGELIGKVGFTALLYHHVTGRRASAATVAVLDAVLVTLMEHGLTPSAIAARMTLHGAPDSVQGAIAAGLLGIGDRFVGTMEGCARLLDRIVAAPAKQRAALARAIAAEHRRARRPVPGFGHNLHKPDDPRTPRLLALAGKAGVGRAHVAALRLLGRAVDAAAGRHVTINATGASAALLRGIGLEAEIMRGVAVVARAAGLLAHVAEERASPIAGDVWTAVERQFGTEAP
ncbi:MAG: citryl-CoA lyase [Alphaproteobacteria bacterium]|nr:citryl-CoA lyase [Alphaproteobacteria bacterium]